MLATASALTPNFVAAALSNDLWDVGNEVLYRLCREHSGHKTDAVILAKVWLIGRSYAAAIERRRQITDGIFGDAFYEKEVAPKIRKEPIDEWFSALVKTATEDTAAALRVHKSLTDLFRQISGMDKRSLASKYLHFHFPDRFYIYDTRAAKAISEVLHRRERQAALAKMALNPGENDPVYASFFACCRELNRQVSSFRPSLTPRELDKVLLWQAAKVTPNV